MDIMITSPAENFIRTIDARELPRYTFGEAARYLGASESTIRAWFEGMPYGSAPRIRYFSPILEPAAKRLLSFYDIASAHVLLALKKRGASTENIRTVIESL